MDIIDILVKYFLATPFIGILILSLICGIIITVFLYRDSIKRLEDHESYEDTTTIVKQSKRKFWISLYGITPLLFIVFILIFSFLKMLLKL